MMLSLIFLCLLLITLSIQSVQCFSVHKQKRHTICQQQLSQRIILPTATTLEASVSSSSSSSTTEKKEKEKKGSLHKKDSRHKRKTPYKGKQYNSIRKQKGQQQINHNDSNDIQINQSVVIIGGKFIGQSGIVIRKEKSIDTSLYDIKLDHQDDKTNEEQQQQQPNRLKIVRITRSNLLVSHEDDNDDEEEEEEEVDAIIDDTKQVHQDNNKLIQVLPDVSSDGNNTMLLEQLEDSFQYDGRLPSKVKTNRDYRCGYVSILGAPNMGKSTLLNALLEENLCITTKRPQTTRHAILGVLTASTSQVCLIDTPGIIEQPAYKLQHGMMEAVKGSFNDADVILVVSDMFSTPIPDDDIYQRILQTTKPIIVAINKIDLEGIAQKPDPIRFHDNKHGPYGTENKDMLLVNEGKTYTVAEAVMKWRSLIPNAIAIIPVCATEGSMNPGVHFLRQLLVGADGIATSIRDMGRPITGMFQPGITFLSDHDVKSLLPFGPPLYDEELLTDRSERFFVSELIRESLFECLKQELPYCCEVKVYFFKEQPKTRTTSTTSIKTKISANIIVERDSQKVIVIGKGGEMIKTVGMIAREKVEKFLDQQVHLYLQVIVVKDWRKNEDYLKEFGYLKDK